jgi:hypothetical protein
MIRSFLLTALFAAFASNTYGQKIIRETPSPTPKPEVVVPKAPPAGVPVKIVPETPSPPATVFRSDEYRFEIAVPGNWMIAGDGFDDSLKSQGFDLSLRAPNELSGVSKARVNRALENVTVLLTAFRTEAGSKDAAILRVAAEDLSAIPAVKDAVDYFDLMRSQFKTMKLPTDFRYSETQAEQLGRRQFAFLDTSTGAGKKRLYATVKGRKALIFTLSYRSDADLQSVRQMLAAGDFNIK